MGNKHNIKKIVVVGSSPSAMGRGKRGERSLPRGVAIWGVRDKIGGRWDMSAGDVKLANTKIVDVNRETEQSNIIYSCTRGDTCNKA